MTCRPMSLKQCLTQCIDIVTTEDGAIPTPDNSKTLNGEGGRGSAVWFNQATMFQTAELGHCTVAEAEEAGIDIASKYTSAEFPSTMH